MQTLYPSPAITPREHRLLDALAAIALETMAYPPLRPISADSYLPDDYIYAAQAALGLYGRAIQPTQVPA